MIDESTGGILKAMTDEVMKLPSRQYLKRSMDAKSLLERAVYKGFSDRFSTTQENALLATEILEHDCVELIQKAARATSLDQKKFYEDTAKLYSSELTRIYKGEV